MTTTPASILRPIPDLDVPHDGRPKTPPRIRFDAITRRQRLLLDDVAARAGEFLLGQAKQEEVLLAELAGLIPDLEAKIATVKGEPKPARREALWQVVNEELPNNGGLALWWARLRQARAEVDRALVDLAVEKAAICVHALAGDWSGVLLDREGSEPPAWPALSGAGVVGVKDRLEIVAGWPEQIVSLLTGHVRDGLARGADRLLEDERKN